MRTVSYDGAALLTLATESAYGDPAWLARAVENFNRIIGRGDGIAVYENHDLGHPELGHRQYISYGSAEAQLETAFPHRYLPDIGGQVNFRYVLIGTCRDQVPVPPPPAEILGVPAELNPVLLRYRVALDNYEPVPRKTGFGQLIRYEQRIGSGPAWKIMLGDMHTDGKTTFLLDDGQSVTACYVASWGPAAGDDGEAWVIAHPFPLSQGTRDDNRWMVGPSRAYHLKITGET